MKYLLAAIAMVVVGVTHAQPIVTDSTSRSTTNSTAETTIKSPPPTAVAPAITTINNDVCAVAATGAVQTQILGISMGGTMRDMNCERIKLNPNNDIDNNDNNNNNKVDDDTPVFGTRRTICPLYLQVVN